MIFNIGSEEDSSSEETSEDSDSTIHVGKPSPRSDDHKCPSDCDKEIHKETLALRAKRYFTLNLTRGNLCTLCVPSQLGLQPQSLLFFVGKICFPLPQIDPVITELIY